MVFSTRAVWQGLGESSFAEAPRPKCFPHVNRFTNHTLSGGGSPRTCPKIGMLHSSVAFGAEQGGEFLRPGLGLGSRLSCLVPACRPLKPG